MSCQPYHASSGRAAPARTGLLLGALVALQAPSAPLTAQGAIVTRGIPAEVGMSAGALASGAGRGCDPRISVKS